MTRRLRPASDLPAGGRRCFTQRRSLFVVLRLVLLSLLPLIAHLAFGSSDDLWDRKRDSDRAYTEQLEALAARAESLELPAAATATRHWIVRRDPRKQYYFTPSLAEGTTSGGTTTNQNPLGTEPQRPAADAPQVLQQWYGKLERLRATRAAELWELAQQAARQKQGALGYQCLHELLREQPDHAAARRALDDSQAPGPGRGQPKQPQSSVARVDHPQLGWRKGQYWRIDSPRFRLYTNHSAAAGIDAARRLELFHQVWRQCFFDIWTTTDALAARLQGRDEALGPRRVHEVILLKSRDEYVEKLQAAEPKIALTTGIYLDKQHVSYFYVGDETTHASWYHEATHQILQELLDAPEGVGSAANMWAIEGVAIYGESLQRHHGYCTLGGIDAPRLQIARYHRLRGAAALPLQELVALGRQALQNHPQIRSLYTQSAGLAHVFLDSQQPTSRMNFLHYLLKVYTRRDQPTSLAESMGRSWRELEAEELRFLNVTDDDLRSLQPLTKLRQLSLGRTQVTNEGLKTLKSHVGRLEWLDVAFTPLSDDGWRTFQEAIKLRQLFLEQTAITDDTLAQIAACKELEELDLSHTKITDTGLTHLTQLKKLKQLYLTGCSISDAAIPSLKSLKQLETLDLSDTQVTTAGQMMLRKSLPKWQPDSP